MEIQKKKPFTPFTHPFYVIALLEGQQKWSVANGNSLKKKGGVVWGSDKDWQNLRSKTDMICSFLQGIRHWKPHFPGYYFSSDQRSGKKGNKQFRHPSLLKLLLPHTAWLRDSKHPGLRTACPSSFDKGGCTQNTCKLTLPSLLSTCNK